MIILLSIVVPTYNSIAKMPSTIESLRALSGLVEHEIIFVDDCSGDGTYEALVSEAKDKHNWRVFQLATNSGSAARPRNVGLDEAKGDYVFFLDSDDIVVPKGIKTAYDFALAYNSDIVRSSIISVKPDGREQTVDRIPRWDTIKDRVSRIRAITKYQSLTCSFLMRRAVLIDSDIRFDEARRIGEDITFTARVLVASERVAYRDMAIRKYVKGGGGQASVTQSISDEDFHGFFQAWEDVENTLERVGVSFMKEHGKAALLYALRQFVWFKRSELTIGTFEGFSEFINRQWATISGYDLPVRYKTIVMAARDGDFSAFTSECRLRLLVAGHDLKFLKDIEPYFHQHYTVLYDKWEGHTGHDLNASRALLDWADYVWVEWLLGAAVWFSNNIRSDQRLIVRVHRSEMVADYGLRIDRSRVSRFVSVSPHCLGDFSDRFDIPREMFSLVPNPLEPERYVTGFEEKAVFRIAIVGIVPQLKGYHRALELLNSLRMIDERYELHVFGKSPDQYPWLMRDESARRYYESCDGYIAEHQLTDAVKLRGWVDTREALAGVGFVLSLSDFEGMHLAPGEAFCANRQGLFRRWRGVEACYPEDFIFDDMASMRDHILAMQDLDSFHELAGKGRDFIKERYSLERVEPLLDRVFAKVRG